MREAFGSALPAGLSADSFTRRSHLVDSSSARSLSPSRSEAANAEVRCIDTGNAAACASVHVRSYPSALAPPCNARHRWGLRP